MKDTLSLYNELLKSGFTESQALAQARQLGGIRDILKEIKNELLWLRLIGGVMTIAFLVDSLKPILNQWFYY